MPQYTVLSTKKLMPSLKVAAMQDGIAIMEQEFIRIHPILSETTQSTVKGLFALKDLIAVFTSSNAVECFLKLVGLNGIKGKDLHWNIFCLEGVTKDAVVDQLPGCSIQGMAPDSGSLA